MVTATATRSRASDSATLIRRTRHWLAMRAHCRCEPCVVLACRKVPAFLMEQGIGVATANHVAQTIEMLCAHADVEPMPFDEPAGDWIDAMLLTQYWTDRA